MKSLQVIYFIDLAKTLNFTETAKHFFVSQPAISKQISALEEELGVQLFHRGQRQVTLTPAGESYASFFDETLEAFEKIKKETIEAARKEIRTIKVSLLAAWNLSGYLPAIVKAYAGLYPEIQLIFDHHTFQELSDQLKRGDIDLAISLLRTEQIKSEWVTEKITEIPALLFYSSAHPILANNHMNISGTDAFMQEKNALKVEAFKGEKFLIYNDQTETYSKKLIQEMIQPFGFTPNVEVVNNVETMILRVETGQGVAIFDDWIRYKSNPSLNYLSLGINHSVMAVWLKARQSVEVERLVGVISEILSR